MSDSNLLAQRRSDVQVRPEEPPKSRSEPTLAKTDVAALYTTPIQGSVSLLVLLLQIVRDILALFVRVGLSIMMLTIDFLLRIFVFVTQNYLNFPGVFALSVVVRLIISCFQVLMWVTYSGLELIFYMRMPFLVVYIGVLAYIYFSMPETVEVLIGSLLWMMEQFVKIVTYFVFRILWKA
ncbi:hypothetical protein BsWGS_17210 [Bradybaena similaris]